MDPFLKDKVIIAGGGAKGIADGIAKAGVFFIASQVNSYHQATGVCKW